MSKKDRDICNAAAKRAPWRLRIPTDGTLMVWPNEKHIVAVARTHREDESKFIAHFNPAKVSKMLDEITQLRTKLEQARGALEKSLAIIYSWAIDGHAGWCELDPGCTCGHSQAQELYEEEQVK